MDQRIQVKKSLSGHYYPVVDGVPCDDMRCDSELEAIERGHAVVTRINRAVLRVMRGQMEQPA